MMEDSVTRQEEERRKVDAHFKELATVLLHRSVLCDAASLITYNRGFTLALLHFMSAVGTDNSVLLMVSEICCCKTKMLLIIHVHLSLCAHSCTPNDHISRRVF